MQFRLTFLAIILLLLVNPSSSQERISPLFKKIQFAGYKINEDGKPATYFYAEVNEKGKITVQMDFLKQPLTIAFQLPDSTIQLINTVFNGRRKLETYLVEKEVEEGVHYAGSSYRFIQVTGKDNKTDEISFIRYILDLELRAVIIALENILDQEELPEVKGPLRPDQKFSTSLSNSYTQSKHLPKFKLPPPGE